MLGIWRNYFLEKRHSRQRQFLIHKFPVLKHSKQDHFLFLDRYFSHIPEQFNSSTISKLYYTYIETEYEQRPDRLLRYLEENHGTINRALIFLHQINNYNWHDDLLSDDYYNRLRFLDNDIHSTYLRILEGVFFPFVHLLAYMSRLNRGKSTEGLDLYNAVDEMKSSFSSLSDFYHNVVRNGISHGNITFTENDIEYRDKSGNAEVMTHREVVRLLDDLLDACNGIALALALFYLVHIPGQGKMLEQLLIDELQAATGSPWWSVEGAVHADTLKGTQLVIFGRPNTRIVSKARYYAFLTASLAEYFAPGYDRYFLSLKSPVAHTGFAAFDGHKLREARLKTPPSFEHYKGVLQDNLFFYIPRPRCPEFLGKLDTYIKSFSVHFSIAVEEIREKLNRPEIVVRSGEVHRSRLWAVLNGFVLIRFPKDVRQETVRKSVQRILRKTSSWARKEHAFPSAVRMLPLGWARISVFQVNYRKRRIVSYGLGQDLICTIQMSRSKKIKAPFLYGSTVEQYGKFHIAWNKSWLEEFGG